MDRLDRIVLRDLRPVIGGTGRAKAIVDVDVPVEVTAFRDGHDIVRARARWRPVDPSGTSASTAAWSIAPLHDTVDDRFVGAVRFERVGAHELVVDAWTDHYATWRRDLVAWMAAGEDIAVELLVGATLLTGLAALVDEPARSRVLDAATTLASTGCTDRVRLAAGLDDAVVDLLDGVVDPAELTSTPTVSVRVERERAAFGAWYEFFPRSEGGLAGATRRLDAVAAMGFDVVYLPPVHPIGTTNRKGRNNALTAGPDDPGSPWAIGSSAGGHTAVEPSLGTLDDFDAFVARAAELGLEVALDYALQCSPDHPWITEHPEWFDRRPDGSIRYAENPPKKYQDIHPLEFWPADDADRVALWSACLDIVRFWMARGVRIFRVDNPHTKPVSFWRWLIDEVAATDPDVVFLSEAFTHPAMMNELAEIGFSQGYTYFTWRHRADELAWFLRGLVEGPGRDWFRPNLWPTTPDILTGALRNGTPAAFTQRAVVAALSSPSWGLYSGYELCENTPMPDKEEYADSEKYRVVARDWDVPTSLAPVITRLNAIRHAHPSMARLDTLRIVGTSDDRLLAFTRSLPGGDGGRDVLLVVVNCEPDTEIEGGVHLDAHSLGLGDRFDVTDELTDETWPWHHGDNYVRLGPDRVAHVLALGVTA